MLLNLPLPADRSEYNLEENSFMHEELIKRGHSARLSLELPVLVASCANQPWSLKYKCHSFHYY